MRSESEDFAPSDFLLIVNENDCVLVGCICNLAITVAAFTIDWFNILSGKM